MGECRNWQTGPTQNRLTAGSSPALPTIIAFILLLCSLTMNAQDQTPKIPTQLEYTREELEVKLLMFMMDRFLWPFDEWCKLEGPSSELPPWNYEDGDGGSPFNKELWYALVIKGDANKGDPIWIKFYISRKEEYDGIAQDNIGCQENWEGCYMLRKRAGIVSALERQFINLMSDSDYKETIIFGQPHLYRLPTPDTDITKLRKEDKIY